MKSLTLHPSPTPVPYRNNYLPASVRDIQSLPAFRQKLKLTLFSERLFCQLNLAFDGLFVMLVVFRYFSFVRCPRNSLLWQRHLNLCIYNNNNNVAVYRDNVYDPTTFLILRSAGYVTCLSRLCPMQLRWWRLVRRAATMAAAASSSPFDIQLATASTSPREGPDSITMIV